MHAIPNKDGMIKINIKKPTYFIAKTEKAITVTNNTDKIIPI